MLENFHHWKTWKGRRSAFIRYFRQNDASKYKFLLRVVRSMKTPIPFSDILITLTFYCHRKNSLSSSIRCQLVWVFWLLLLLRNLLAGLISLDDDWDGDDVMMTRKMTEDSPTAVPERIHILPIQYCILVQKVVSTKKINSLWTRCSYAICTVPWNPNTKLLR